MKIELKTRLSVDYFNEEDKKRAEIMAMLVEHKLGEKNYSKRLNELLSEALGECLEDVKNPVLLSEQIEQK